ncbi:DUF937 domain-containing protein [Neorhizobium lilium]|uniref:DUF937 domain-containing protein n=1 Tax=Neorhizobium lilium TaxID=2503024 RepID=A0A3S3RFX5_9HYPH|nr:YidB family protein [Neorhizobium lilium]RWX76679.1 DUF937 domain-containing protein [Neorhizobium lilium]
MQRGPLKALLAVLAVAGYQNRDRIAEILKGVTERPQTSPGASPETRSGSSAQTSGEAATEGAAAPRPAGGGLDDVMEKLRNGGLGSLLGGALGGGATGGGALGGGIGSILNGGLNDLLDQFRQAGHEKKADSWVGTGANEPIDDSELHQALGPDVVRDVAAKTGLSEEEVLRRLSKNLPEAVDGLTPGGSVPPVQGTI